MPRLEKKEKRIVKSNATQHKRIHKPILTLRHQQGKVRNNQIFKTRKNFL